jgi:hypothetical protein
MPSAFSMAEQSAAHYGFPDFLRNFDVPLLRKSFSLSNSSVLP